MKAMMGDRNKEGAILGIVLIVMLAISIIGLSLFSFGRHSSREAIYELKSAQAFWIAEAGIRRCVSSLYAETWGSGFNEVAFGEGTYSVVQDDADSDMYLSTGTVMMGDQPISRQVRVRMEYIAESFEDAVYSANIRGQVGNSGTEWSLKMHGTKKDKYGNFIEGPPVPNNRGNFWGGNDIVSGNVNVNGGVRLYDESAIEKLPADDNPYEIASDIECHFGEFYADGTASYPREPIPTTPGSFNPPDLDAMDYSHNNDWDVAAEFAKFSGNLVAAGNDGGYRLPPTHALHDVVVLRNNGDTEGVDYYFEPKSMSTSGETPATGKSLITLGDDVTYYVDGHVWFRSTSTYGFVIDGQSTIVSSKDIHIGDNIMYQDRGRDSDSDMLALVALGELTSAGEYDKHGDVYFGDPDTGTLYLCDAFMFANNNFLYNTSIDGDSSKQQPESGFKVYGNFMAMNQVVVKRDWYPAGNSYKPAEFVEVINSDGTTEWAWVDADSGTRLTEDQQNGIRHYAMEVNYDDRIRDIATQMSGLPQGQGSFIAGYTWEEL
ncbi:pilus assembly PilX N-terminal domain-containing protein [Pontiellaceae bacterium B1224]|nr:pilus assembly PilX N-terminal domain-containing protein [Pontiellaceae bacterium B1224]